MELLKLQLHSTTQHTPGWIQEALVGDGRLQILYVGWWSSVSSTSKDRDMQDLMPELDHSLLPPANVRSEKEGEEKNNLAEEGAEKLSIQHPLQEKVAERASRCDPPFLLTSGRLPVYKQQPTRGDEGQQFAWEINRDPLGEEVA